MKKRVFGLALIISTLMFTPVTFAFTSDCDVKDPSGDSIAPYEFENGKPANALDVNKNFDCLYATVKAIIDKTTALEAENQSMKVLNSPVGSIVAWHKDFENTPELPDNWVECNGQTLDDPESPYHEQVIPNINGDASGDEISGSPGSGKSPLALRGAGTDPTGTFEGDAFQGHWHRTEGYSAGDTGGQNGARNNPIRDNANSYSFVADDEITTALTDGVHGDPRIADETRAKSMKVVWIIKVKDMY